MTVRLLPLPPNTTFESGMTAGSVETALSSSFSTGVSMSAISKEIGPALVSSLIFWSGMSEMDGPSLTGLTLRLKDSSDVAVPSVATSVMRASPN